MAIFQYKVFTKSGKEEEGHIEATSIQAAQRKLKTSGFYIKEIKEDTTSRDRGLFPFLSKILYRIPRKEIGLFVKQLGTLLGAGISLDEAMSDIYENTTNQHLKKIIMQLKEDVTQGSSLSEALSKHPEIFPPVYENMVRVGEATGSYEITLDRLAELEEKNAQLKGKALTAMIYPTIMVVVMLAVVFFLLTSVVPQIKVMYSTFEGAELPLPTRIVISLSEMVDSIKFFILPAVFGLYYLFYRYRKKPEGKLKTDRLSLNLPIFGMMLKKIQVARFARNLGVLLEANVPLLKALEIVAGTINNEVFKNELYKAGHEIREGGTLKSALSQSEILPHMAKGMIAAGESTDRVAELLIKVAEILDIEVDTAVQGLTTSLEPIMIVIMGVMVGGIMASVMMPMYKMTELIK